MKPPKIIYLQIGEDVDAEDVDNWSGSEVITWCVDQIHDTDIEYRIVEDEQE